LNNQPFACEADAIKAAEQFARKLKYHKLQYKIKAKNLYEKKGRPECDEKPARQEWYISGNLFIDNNAVGAASGRKGFFSITTNELDYTALNYEQMLGVYKAQGVSVERGFRFLKDPMFYAESLYLKNSGRIMALIMIMALSLLVYSLAERKLRKKLEDADLSVPNQLGKPTRTPTIRWIFQLFYPVMILSVHKGEKMKPILQYFEPYHEVVLKCLGDNVKKMYFLKIEQRNVGCIININIIL